MERCGTVAEACIIGIPAKTVLAISGGSEARSKRGRHLDIDTPPRTQTCGGVSATGTTPRRQKNRITGQGVVQIGIVSRPSHTAPRCVSQVEVLTHMDRTALVVIGLAVLVMVVVLLFARTARGRRGDLVPLSDGSRDRYVTEWDRIEMRFV